MRLGNFSTVTVPPGSNNGRLRTFKDRITSVALTSPLALRGLRKWGEDPGRHLNLDMHLRFEH